MFYRVIFLLAIHNCLAQETFFNPKRRCINSSLLYEQPELEFRQTNQLLSKKEELLEESINRTLIKKNFLRDTVFNNLLKEEILKFNLKKFLKILTINRRILNREERFNLGGEYQELTEEEATPYPELFSEQEENLIDFLKESKIIKECLQFESHKKMTEEDLIDLLEESRSIEEYLILNPNKKTIEDYFADFVIYTENLMRLSNNTRWLKLISVNEKEDVLKEVSYWKTEYNIFLECFRDKPKSVEQLDLSPEFRKKMDYYMHCFEGIFEYTLNKIQEIVPEYNFTFAVDREKIMMKLKLINPK